MTEIRVLVVDDDPMQLAMVERALPSEWFAVCCVASVADVMVKGPSFGPHIVLADVNMPDLPEDRSIVAMLREAVPGARIVLYSAWEEARLRRLAMQLGADAYISKSVSVIGIGNRLRELHGGMHE
jgi:two-component system, OmpR family, response regulator